MCVGRAVFWDEEWIQHCSGGLSLGWLVNSVRHFCTCSSLTTVTPNKTIITACVQQHCALLTQNCSELSLQTLSNGSRHIQMIKHLHPLKDIIRRAPPAYYFHFRAFGAIDRCGCTHERIAREGKTSTKIISLHPSINMMENLPLHWRQWVSPLKGQYGQINYSLWCLSDQRHTAWTLIFSSVESTGSPCSFQSFFLLLKMVDTLSLNSCRYAEAFFSRACWKPKNSQKEGGDWLGQV